MPKDDAEKSKRRVRKFRRKEKRAGLVSLSAYVTPETHDRITAEQLEQFSSGHSITMGAAIDRLVNKRKK